MIKTIRHKGLAGFYKSGQSSGVQPSHMKRLRMQLAILDTAQSIDDIDLPGFGLHRLKGQAKNRWSIKVNGNWRLTFELREGDVYLLDYEDYH
jgi:toxin HigB-1